MIISTAVSNSVSNLLNGAEAFHDEEMVAGKNADKMPSEDELFAAMEKSLEMTRAAMGVAPQSAQLADNGKSTPDMQNIGGGDISTEKGMP